MYYKPRGHKASDVIKRYVCYITFETKNTVWGFIPTGVMSHVTPLMVVWNWLHDFSSPYFSTCRVDSSTFPGMEETLWLVSARLEWRNHYRSTNVTYPPAPLAFSLKTPKHPLKQSHKILKKIWYIYIVIGKRLDCWDELSGAYIKSIHKLQIYGDVCWRRIN